MKSFCMLTLLLVTSLLLSPIGCSTSTSKPQLPDTPSATATSIPGTTPGPTPAFTPIPVPTPTSTPPVVLPYTPLPSPTPSYTHIYYSDLLDMVYPLIDEVLPYTGIYLPGEAAMTHLQSRLRDRGLRTGLVGINKEHWNSGYFYSVIAVETIDLGIVYLDIVPSGLEVADKNDRTQFVYLSEGKRIGLIPARLASSSEYSWYNEYLQDTYSFYDYLEYLQEYSSVLGRNAERLSEIDIQNEEIRSYLEDPPMATYYSNSMGYDETDRRLQELATLGNRRVDRYNGYVVRLNLQVEDFNGEVEAAEQSLSRYPNEVFYVKEIWIGSPTVPYPQMPTLTPIPMPRYLVPLYFDVADYVSALQRMISEDDSYNQLRKPNQDLFRFERITDSSFVVTNYEIEW